MSLLAVCESLPPCCDNTVHEFLDQKMGSANDIRQQLQQLRTAAKNKAENF